MAPYAFERAKMGKTCLVPRSRSVAGGRREAIGRRAADGRRYAGFAIVSQSGGGGLDLSGLVFEKESDA